MSPLCRDEKIASSKRKSEVHAPAILSSMEIETKYALIKFLGKGTYGEVLLGKNKHTGDLVAIKTITKKKIKEAEIIQEFNYGYSLAVHPNILQTYASFEAMDCYFLTMEYARFGNLYHAMTPGTGISEITAKIALKQVVPALEYLHTCGIVHGDVIPDNILIHTDTFSKVKLADFGQSRYQGTPLLKSSNYNHYTPPEVLGALADEDVVACQSQDSWSLAVTIFVLLTGKRPWKLATMGDNDYDSFVLWQSKKIASVPIMWSGLSEKLLKYFRRTLHTNASHRFPVSELSKYWLDTWTIKRRYRRYSQEMDESLDESPTGDFKRSPTLWRSHMS